MPVHPNSCGFIGYLRNISSSSKQLTTSTYKTSATSDSAYGAMSVEDVCELGSLLQSGDKEKEMLERKLLELDGGIQNQDRRVRDVLSHFISKTSRH